MSDISRIPMNRAYPNLKRAIKKEKNRSPYVFYQAYEFLNTFRYEDNQLKQFESLVNQDVESEIAGTEWWRSLHDILHAIKAQKNYEW